MIAYITRSAPFESKKGNKLVKLHVVDNEGLVDTIIIRADDPTPYVVTECDLGQSITPTWYQFDFDRKGWLNHFKEL